MYAQKYIQVCRGRKGPLEEKKNFAKNFVSQSYYADNIFF